MRARGARALAVAALAHAALLVLPGAALGASLRPQAIAIVLLVVAFGAIETRARRGVDPSRFGAPGTRLALASALLLLVTTWLALASSRGTWLGAPLVLSGALLRAWSIRALGDAFTSETVAPRLRVRRGPYALVRHPSELGLLAVGAGVVLLGTSAASIAALAALGTTSLLRMRAEGVLLDAARPTAHGGALRRLDGADPNVLAYLRRIRGARPAAAAVAPTR